MPDDTVEDIGLLQYELEQAWRLMKHHADLAAENMADFKMVSRYNECAKIKTTAFDKAVTLLRVHQSADWRDEKGRTLIELIRENLLEAARKFDAERAKDKNL